MRTLAVHCLTHAPRTPLGSVFFAMEAMYLPQGGGPTETPFLDL